MATNRTPQERVAAQNDQKRVVAIGARQLDQIGEAFHRVAKESVDDKRGGINDLAERLGTSAATVGRWLKGASTPELENIVRLCVLRGEDLPTFLAQALNNDAQTRAIAILRTIGADERTLSQLAQLEVRPARPITWWLHEALRTISIKESASAERASR